ncbi:MAG: DUF1572 family protein [Bacteroidota bacterium]
MEPLSISFLDHVIKQFKYYKQLGDHTFEQLEEAHLFWQYNKASNSIAIIVKHLWGNMRSRWTNFLTTDGEKPWRNRDSEFEADFENREELMQKWEEGWKCLFEALQEINTGNFDQLVYIRNTGHTIPEAVDRQLAHYAYHVGQIVYIGRMLKGDDWMSLSVPKGQSRAYNEKKFSQPKHKGFFTDEFLEEGN